MTEQERKDFLEAYGLKESDVCEDDKGEYVLIERPVMDEGEEENYKPKKVYLE